MPRKREGSVEFRGGCWQAHLWFRLPKKHREWVRLEGIPADDRETAKAAAAYAQQILDERGYVPNARDLTVNEWFPRWIALREKLWPDSWGNDNSNFKLYIADDLGLLPMRGVTRDHLRSLVRRLDQLVLDDEIAWQTARNIWHTATRMFTDATQSNEPGVAVVEQNPARDIEGPRKGIEKEKQLLHPDEFLKLVSCPHVPIVYARLYTVAVYTQMREAEELAFDLADLDLAHGMIHIHESIDVVRDDEKKKPTKGRKSRRARIEPELLPLLEAMHRQAGGIGRLFPNPPTVTGEYGLANILREHLKLAGVTRAELTERLATRMPIRFHDLRATGVTWRLKRGDAPIDVQQDAGHKSFSTTEVYMRLARDIAGPVFPPLPARLLGATGKSPRKAHVGYSGAYSSGNSWAQQDLNL